MIHRNSRESYEQCKGDEGFKRVIHRIAWFFENNNDKGYTDRQVLNLMWEKGQLPRNEPNMVRPKINKLIQDGMLEEVGNVYDADTKRTVRSVRWKMKERLF